MANPSVLEVLLHGREIGTLTQLGGDRNLFAFNDDYINDPERLTLSLSFQDAYGELIVDIKPTQTRVPPFFANLLPEGRMREYLAARAGVKERRDFPLLWILGQDLPGAIEIRPADGEEWPPSSESDAEANAEETMSTAYRFSLAGVQLKFSAVNDARGGLTIPVKGIGGDWIVKLPSTAFSGVLENEYSMMTLAREIGIDIPELKLVDLKGIEGLPSDVTSMDGKALAIKRFDRSPEGRIHIEDFAQVLGLYPERKYERASYRNIAQALWIRSGEEAIVEFIRRLIFTVLIGNADMHLKNWSLIYPDQIAPNLAPAYDLVSTIAFMPDDKLALTFGRSKAWEAINTDEIRYFAGKAELPETILVETAKETVQKFLEVWGRNQNQLALTSEMIQVVEQHIAKVPLVEEAR
jgi:serine/threonine-protein kinase HipA